MGILDEAIREHLELKRQHGADQSELKQLEDEAFGSPARPGDEGSGDQVAEAPTEFMTQPDAPETPAADVEERPAFRGEGSLIADLQEPPPAPKSAEAEAEAPAEEPSATEHEVVEPAEPASSGPNTQEREAIAEHPTEMYDVEEELAGVEDAGAAAAPADAFDDEDEDDDFWDEKRLSDELDQALEAPPVEDEGTGEDEEGGEDEEEPRAQPAGEGDEDVLEETPEFLEESPEDDELWFEQKPPKDFDFDD
jgi:hypothetical protein